MNRSTWIKRAVATFLVVLMSINSFAAVVGDNDGAAFITKAEFESLKNDFQTQINRYNTSLDNKIDGAIASYIAGARVGKQENVKLLVDNYSDMMWVRDYYVYGKWRKWTARTTYTEQNSNAWFKPSLNEKRRTFRNGDVQVIDHWSTAFMYAFVRYNFRITSFNNGVINNENSAKTYTVASAGLVPTALVKLIESDDGAWVVDTSNPLVNSFIDAPYLYIPEHGLDEFSGAYVYNLGQFNASLNKITVNAISGNQIFNITNKLNYNGGTDNVTARSVVTNDMVEWPPGWQGGGPLSLSSAAAFASTTYAYRDGLTVSNYFSTGCTWNLMDSATATSQIKSFNNLMLGKDCNTKVNIGKHLGKDNGERVLYDLKDAKSFGSLSGNWLNGRYMETAMNTSAAVPFVTLGNTGSLGIPHWPTEDLKKLTTGMFSYNNNRIKFGQGLPLIIDNQSDGTLQIQFEYNVKNILNNAIVNNKIHLDVKKSDFMLASGDAGYIDDYVKNAYSGFVNPATTTSAEITLHNYAINSSTGTIQLTIPIKTNESLWFRIAPQDTTMGIYVGIKNLRITKITE